MTPRSWLDDIEGIEISLRPSEVSDSKESNQITLITVIIQLQAKNIVQELFKSNEFTLACK